MIQSCVKRLLEGEEGKLVVQDMRGYYKTEKSCSLSSKVSLVRRHFMNHPGNENKHKDYKKTLEEFKKSVLKDTKVNKDCKDKAMKFIGLEFPLQCKMARMHASNKFCFDEKSGESSTIDKEFKKVKLLPENLSSFVASDKDLEECREHVKESKKNKHFDACIISNGNKMLQDAREIVDKYSSCHLFEKGRQFKFDGKKLIVRFPYGYTSEQLLSEKKRRTKLDEDCTEIVAKSNTWNDCTSITGKRIILCMDGKYYNVKNSAPRYNISEHALGLLLMCGRRTAELMNGKSEFSNINSSNMISFDGQLKKRFPDEKIAYNIPVLIDSSLFLNSLQNLRNEQGDVSDLSNDDISIRYHSGLSRKLDELFPDANTVHNIRGIYINMAFRMFQMGKKSLNAAIMTYLGHETVDVSLSYSHIVLEQFSTGKKQPLKE